MAKLKGKAKAAFLRRMARGRAKARGTTVKTGRGTRKRAARRRMSFSGTLRPSRKRPGVVRLQIRQNPLQALIANPGGALVPYSPHFAAYQMRRHTKKRRTSTMAKKRRKRRYARRAAPRTVRRRRRSGAARRIRRAIRVPKRYAHRVYRPRGRKPVYLNPRRRVRRRKNPSLGGGLLKAVVVPYAAGFIASGVIAVLDTGLANYPTVKQLAKVGGAFLIAIFGRKHPTASVAAIASLAGSQGYAIGTKVAGGFIAQTPAQATKGLGEMARTYPEMGALLMGGVGALLNGMGDPSNPSNVVDNYASALNNMAESDDD